MPDAAAAKAATIAQVLWYNVFATEDAQQRLGGNPYTNIERQYSGSSDDAALNAGVDRYEPVSLAVPLSANTRPPATFPDR